MTNGATTPAAATPVNWMTVLEQFLQANPTLFPQPAAGTTNAINLSMFIPLLPPQYQGIATLLLPFAEQMLGSTLSQTGTTGSTNALSGIPLIGGLIAMFSGLFGGSSTPAAAPAAKAAT